MAPRNGQLWEAFWHDLPNRVGEAFWDCPPTDGAATHVELFVPYFDKGLPLVDLGCGNGTQTRYLATLFDRVLGVDIAEAALERARRDNPASNVEYLALDVLDTAQVRAFHDRFGDVNIYLSGVIHQIPVAQRVACAQGLATLAGTRGCVFNQELTPGSYQYMRDLIANAGNDLPKLDRVSLYFRIGLQPTAGEAELDTVYAAAGFDILASGDLSLRTTETMSDGSALTLPTSYVVAKPTA